MSRMGGFILGVGIAFIAFTGIAEHFSETGLKSKYLKFCAVLILILGFLMCVKELW